MAVEYALVQVCIDILFNNCQRDDRGSGTA